MSVEYIRNIAFAGQAGAGKTSLIERLLFQTKTTKASENLSAAPW